MQNITDSESGVTVVEEPYIEEERDALKLTLETVPALDPQAVGQELPVDPEKAPHFERAPFPPFWSPQPPVILGHPAVTLHNYNKLGNEYS